MATVHAGRNVMSSRLPKIRLLQSEEECHALIARRIRELARVAGELRILEAGCGRRWMINLEGVNFTLVGVDLDKAALDIRVKEEGDLNEAIVGDLTTVTLPDRSFHVIYSSFVLEHVQAADKVMSNFRRWLKPGGLIIIRIPDRDSARGVITRASPYWFHVFYYRHVLGDANAGKPGFAPYRTYYHPIVSRSGIHAYCQENGFSILDESSDGADVFGGGIVGWVSKAFGLTVSALSLGRVGWMPENLLYVLKEASGGFGAN